MQGAFVPVLLLDQVAEGPQLGDGRPLPRREGLAQGSDDELLAAYELLDQCAPHLGLWVADLDNGIGDDLSTLRANRGHGRTSTVVSAPSSRLPGRSW